MFVENTASEMFIPVIQRYLWTGKGENLQEFKCGSDSKVTVESPVMSLQKQSLCTECAYVNTQACACKHAHSHTHT